MKIIELVVETLVRIPVENKDLSKKEIIDYLNDAEDVTDLLHFGEPQLQEVDLSNCKIVNGKGSVILYNNENEIEWMRKGIRRRRIL